MKLKAIITTEQQSSLPEALRGLYEPRDDGRLQLSVEAVDGYSLANNSGALSALEKERHNAKSAKSALARFDGIDPEEARRALELMRNPPAETGKQWEGERKKLLDSWEVQKKEIAGKAETEKKALQAEAARVRGALEKHLIQNEARRALTEAGGSPELLMPHVMNRVRLAEDGESFKAEVYDPASGVARIGNTNGDPMAIDGLVAELKAHPGFAAAFAGSGATGSGGQAGAGSTPPSQIAPRVISSSSGGMLKASDIDAIASGEAKRE